MKDPALRAVSLAARGLWIDMLCLMFESARRGYLVHATGHPVTPEQIARMAGCSCGEIASVLKELEDCGVFSRTRDGTIYSRRMDRDDRKRTLCSEAGKRGGGNPTFKSQAKGGDKGDGKGGSKPNPNPSSSSSTSESTKPLSLQRQRECPGSVETVIGQGQFIGLPEEQCRLFWDTFEAKGWVDANGIPIRDWNARLRRWGAEWRAKTAAGPRPRFVATTKEQHAQGF